MRDLLTFLISVQMTFAPAVVFAQPAPPPPADATPNAGDIPAPPPPGDNAATPAASTPPPPPPGAQAATPVDQPTDAADGGAIPQNAKPTRGLHCKALDCNEFLMSVKAMPKGKKAIADQLAKPGASCESLSNKVFLQKLVIIARAYEAARTEPCDECLAIVDRFENKLKSTPDGGKGPTADLRAVTNAVTCQLGTDPRPAPPAPVTPAPVTPPPPPPGAGGVAETQVYTRPSHRQPVVESVETGWGGNGGGGGGLFGGGSFMNSNLMWGIGGLAIGGILGYMIGKNNQQQQPPYWQGLGPNGGPYGQVPPWGSQMGRPPLPYMYPAGGGFGMGGPMAQRFGAPNILPYGGGAYGQPGNNNMIPINGYGGYGGGYNLGTGFSGGCGFCSNAGTNWGGYNSPVYNYPPNILPYR